MLLEQTRNAKVPLRTEVLMKLVLPLTTFHYSCLYLATADGQKFVSGQLVKTFSSIGRLHSIILSI